MKTQGSHPVSILKRKRHSKALRRSVKMHPARFSRPKSPFLTIPILVAGTKSRQTVRPKLTESFPFNYMLKSKFSLSRHFEYANEQITYHFWL
jgi:hypothetical protein